MVSQDSTSRAAEESSVRSGAEMADFLKLLEKACSLAGERRMTMLRKMSRIPQVSLKTFSNFDTDRLSPNNRDVIKHLESLDFVGIGENVVIVGDQGTGKTHIAQAIGNRCCGSLVSVRYYKMEELSAKMREYVLKGKQVDLITTLSNIQSVPDNRRGRILRLPRRTGGQRVLPGPGQALRQGQEAYSFHQQQETFRMEVPLSRCRTCKMRAGQDNGQMHCD